MYKQLATYIDSLDKSVSGISRARKEKLINISDYIRQKRESGELAKLLFVCTHNSRRSHMAQIWAAALSDYFELQGVETFSAGTEATAFNPGAIQALRRAGFKIIRVDGDQPHFKVFYDDEKEPFVCFSKTFEDPTLPESNFAAIMTCSEADRNCPVVHGSARRITVPYEDPGQADGTPLETQAYDERCHQIAVEMYYMLSRVKGTQASIR